VGVFPESEPACGTGVLFESGYAPPPACVAAPCAQRLPAADLVKARRVVERRPIAGIRPPTAPVFSKLQFGHQKCRHSDR
jgi:hypothetical protein